MENVNIHSMIRERFAKLPPKLQEAIASTEVAEKLRTLSQKHRLHLDQGQILENETYMVLLGIEQAEKYEENLKKELKISDEDAQKISNDVAKEIFLSIRNLLKESTTATPEPDTKLESKPDIKPEPIPESKPETKPEPLSEAPVSAPISAPTPVSTPPPQAPASTPVEAQNKLKSIVKNQSKELEIGPTKKYTVDPYREPID